MIRFFIAMLIFGLLHKGLMWLTNKNAHLWESDREAWLKKMADSNRAPV